MKNLRKISLVSIVCAALLAGCGTGKSAAPTETQPATPQTDFHSYINAQWLKDTKLKANESQVDNLSQLSDKTQETIKGMIAQLDADYSTLQPDSDEKKLIDFYRLAADFESRNRLGLEPVKPYLEEIQKVTTMAELNKVLLKLYSKNIRNLLNLTVSQDIMDSNKNSLYLDPHKLSFPKENYEGTDDFSVKNQQAFKTYLQTVFTMAGNSSKEAATKAEKLIKLEKELASAQLPQEKANDITGTYNPKSWDQVKALAPNLPIADLAANLGVQEAPFVVVTDPEALKKASEVYQEKNLEALKALLQYRVIAHYSDYLSEDLIEAKAKYDGVATGAVDIPSPEALAQSAIDENFSDMIGKIYVKHHFSEESKATIQAMVQELKATYADRIKAVQWMSDETKVRALRKLDTLVVKIGYPDKWRDYSHYSIQPKEEGGTILAAVEMIQTQELQEEMAQLSQPFDKSQFGMPAHMVNAYYSPGSNEIVFPAGILQAPLYDPNASPEENLGGIGAVIGHEISHAFDKAGSQFDENGNLVNWWKPEDLEKFNKKVQQAADIYSKLEVAPGYYVNGEISTGEIMADLGGLTVAIDIAQKKGYDTKKVFESYGRAWREVTTQEFAIASISDEHPPAKYRVNNIVNQIDQFYTDFNVKEGDPMYVKPEDRLRVW